MILSGFWRLSHLQELLVTQLQQRLGTGHQLSRRQPVGATAAQRRHSALRTQKEDKTMKNNEKTRKTSHFTSFQWFSMHFITISIDFNRFSSILSTRFHVFHVFVFYRLRRLRLQGRQGNQRICHLRHAHVARQMLHSQQQRLHRGGIHLKRKETVQIMS